MYGLNLELTTSCPLRCPQCYCTLEGGRHLRLETAKEKIIEAEANGVRVLHLSGGETLCYPWLYELIEFAHAHCNEVNVALSGWGFDEHVFSKLVRAGITGIFISLNGSTKALNSLTRDGYEYAIHALEVLRAENYQSTTINWVMHSNNSSDFTNALNLAEEYRVKRLTVLSFKPDSHHQMKSFPNGEQIVEVAENIRAYRGKVQLCVETCFSQLLAVLKDTKLFGNLNVGPAKGCRAGLYNYCISVDGLYSPCRHIDLQEKFDTLNEYLDKSKVIQKLRAVEHDIRNPCSSCYYKNNCRPCMAVTNKLNGEIYFGHSICSLWKTKI